MSAITTQTTLEADCFQEIAALAYRESGILLVPEKILMVQSRLKHRLRELSIGNFNDYTALVCSDSGRSERKHMISALTTNVSHFFREPHHFKLLTDHLLPLFRKRISAGKRIRIWSAGCSNGQEPYSLAIHLCRAEPALVDADFKILATDIDQNVVAFAERGTYPVSQLKSLRQEDTAKFFTDAANCETPSLTVCDALRALVSFRELNLLASWPMRQTFDAIFCRNVIIYFDVATQERLWPRFHAALDKDGLFFLGHSERIVNAAAYGFSTIGPTAYAQAGHHSATTGRI